MPARWAASCLQGGRADLRLAVMCLQLLDRCRRLAEDAAQEVACKREAERALRDEGKAADAAKRAVAAERTRVAQRHDAAAVVIRLAHTPPCPPSSRCLTPPSLPLRAARRL